MTSEKPRTLHDIPGWFFWPDQCTFRHFLGKEAVRSEGNLVELGTYLGRSAVLVGDYLQDGETFTALDLFGGSTDEHNKAENDGSYRNLTREAFEANYLALHDELPVIVQDLSSAIVDHVPPGSVRFMHIDASHLYEHVVVDIESARTLLAPGGVVAFDDFRSEHTPGVSAAVWEAVIGGGLRPIATTSLKMYCTFDEDVTPHRDALERAVPEYDELSTVMERYLGQDVLRVVRTEKPKPASKAPGVPDVLAKLGELEKRLTAADVGSAQLERLDQQGARLQQIERDLSQLQTLRQRLDDLEGYERAEAKHTRKQLAALREQVRDSGFSGRVMRRLRKR